MGERLVFFVRHGATAANEQTPYILQGCRVDNDLSQTGVRQAEQTRDFLKEIKFAAVYTSPMRRARQTAEIIAAPHRLGVHVVDDLREVDVGEWEGLSYEEIARRFPEQFAAFCEDAARHGYPGGETLADVERRVVPAIEKILCESPGGPLLVVWHNTVGRVYLAHLLGAGPTYARRLSLSNGGISVVRYGSGVAQVLTINSTCHLSPGPSWLRP